MNSFKVVGYVPVLNGEVVSPIIFEDKLTADCSAKLHQQIYFRRKKRRLGAEPKPKPNATYTIGDVLFAQVGKISL